MMSLDNSVIQKQLYFLFLQQELYVQRENLRYQLFILWDNSRRRRIKL